MTTDIPQQPALEADDETTKVLGLIEQIRAEWAQGLERLSVAREIAVRRIEMGAHGRREQQSPSPQPPESSPS